MGRRSYLLCQVYALFFTSMQRLAAHNVLTLVDGMLCFCIAVGFIGHRGKGETNQTLLEDGSQRILRHWHSGLKRLQKRQRDHRVLHGGRKAIYLPFKCCCRSTVHRLWDPDGGVQMVGSCRSTAAHQCICFWEPK